MKSHFSLRLAFLVIAFISFPSLGKRLSCSQSSDLMAFGPSWRTLKAAADYSEIHGHPEAKTFRVLAAKRLLLDKQIEFRWTQEAEDALWEAHQKPGIAGELSLAELRQKTKALREGISDPLVRRILIEARLAGADWGALIPIMKNISKDAGFAAAAADEVELSGREHWAALLRLAGERAHYRGHLTKARKAEKDALDQKIANLLPLVVAEFGLPPGTEIRFENGIPQSYEWPAQIDETILKKLVEFHSVFTFVDFPRRFYTPELTPLRNALFAMAVQGNVHAEKLIVSKKQFRGFQLTEDKVEAITDELRSHLYRILLRNFGFDVNSNTAERYGNYTLSNGEVVTIVRLLLASGTIGSLTNLNAVSAEINANQLVQIALNQITFFTGNSWRGSKDVLDVAQLYVSAIHSTECPNSLVGVFTRNTERDLNDVSLYVLALFSLGNPSKFQKIALSELEAFVRVGSEERDRAREVFRRLHAEADSLGFEGPRVNEIWKRVRRQGD